MVTAGIEANVVSKKFLQACVKEVYHLWGLQMRTLFIVGLSMKYMWKWIVHKMVLHSDFFFVYKTLLHSLSELSD
jgi:hypothetical protein